MSSKKPLLDIDHLKKSYGEKIVLNDISLQIEEGEVVGLLGENGAGKTTLMNCIAGAVSCFEGQILYQGRDMRKYSQMRREFGILIHARFLDYLTAEENLKVLGMYSGIEKNKLNMEIAGILKIVGLYEKKDEHTNAFSFGQLQRLGVAQAILGKKRCLILDEPFVGLDSAGKEALEQIILKSAKEKKCSILLSSHDMDEVERVCDSIAIIKKGYVVFRDKFYKQKKLMVQVTLDGNKLNEYIQHEKLEGMIKVEGNNVISINNTDIHGKVLNILGKDGMIRNIECVSDSVGQLFNNVVQGKM